MGIGIESKLNQLQRIIPHKGVVTASHLKKHGISSGLVQKYLQGGWLERFGFGAFKRPGEPINWDSALSAAQTQLAIPVHVGARTALELKGKAHYMKFGKKGDLFLFGLRGEKKLPKWFSNGPWENDFKITYNDLFSEAPAKSLSKIDIEAGSLTVSSPERAALEMLYHVPTSQTFDEASLIFENFVSFRTKLVQQLLENCNSIKSKRLFLFLAEKHNHEWFSGINLSKIDLGSGKRDIVKGGRLDNKYLITVPKSLYSKEPQEEQI